MNEIKWEIFELGKDQAKEMKVDKFTEPSPKECLFLSVYERFGGICSVQELWQITEIVYKAYQRIESGSQVEINKNCGTVKVRRIQDGTKKPRPRTRHTR